MALKDRADLERPGTPGTFREECQGLPLLAFDCSTQARSDVVSDISTCSQISPKGSGVKEYNSTQLLIPS